MNIKISLILIALAGVLLGVAMAQIATPYLFPSSGNVESIGVGIAWLNGSLVTTIDWGTCENSTAYTYEAFNITNIKTAPVTLTITTQDLSTSIIALTLMWNYTDTVLEPNQWVIVELTQNITATGPFTYTTVITATEA